MSAPPVSAHTVRASARAAGGKKIYYRSFSLRKHSPEQVAAAIAEWKKAVKAGAGLKAKAEGAPKEAPAAAVSADPLLLPLSPFTLDLPEKTGATLVALGSSKSGKTTALTWIYNVYLKKFVTLLCSPSEHSSAYDDWKGKGLVRAQDFYPELQAKAHRVQKKTKNKHRIAFVIDDVVNAKLSPELKKLYSTERNSRVYTFQALQAPRFLDKAARFNVNFILGFAYRTPEGVNDAVECFGSLLPGKTRDEKARAYELNTRDHCFLFMDQLAGELKRCRIPHE